MIKRRFFLILMVMNMVLCVSIFASGSNEAEADTGGVTEITWWNLSSRNELTERVVADFNAANPDIKINYVLNATDDHTPNLMIAASSNSMPDMWFNWGGTLGSFFPENEVSYDLSDYAKANNWNEKFSQTSLDLATFDGNLAGIPCSVNMIGMFYRKDIFDAVGVKEPTTFAEFENVLATLKSNGHTPLILCGKSGWHVMRFVEALIEMYAGSEEHDRISAGTSSWDQDAVVKAFAKFKEYIDKGYLPEGFITLGGSDAKSLMFSGDGIMSPEGPWMESNIFANEQDPEKFGYFHIPLSDKGNRMSGFVEMLQVKAGISDAKFEAVMRFADWLYSPESINTYGSLIKQPVPRFDNTLPATSVLTKEMIKDLNEYGSYTISDQGLPQEVAAILFEAQDSVATGIMTPGEAAKFMDSAVTAYYKSK